MPVVLPAAVILVALIMLLLALAATIIVENLLRHVSFEIPHIGHVTIPGVGAIARAVERAWRDWLEPHLVTIVGWWDAVADAIGRYQKALGDFATALAHDLRHYSTVKAHQLVYALIRPLQADVLEALHAARDALAGLVTVEQLAHALFRDAERHALSWINDLRGDAAAWVRDLRADARAWVRAVESTIATDVLPRLGRIEVELPDLRAWLGRLEGRLEDLRAWWLPLAAAFSGAAVAELLRRFEGCRPSSDRLCQTDPAFLEELLGIAFLVASIEEIQAFVRTAAPMAGDLADEFLVR